MINGNFKSFRHEHLFSEQNGYTTMKDRLTYETPFGVFGKIFDKRILKNYLTTFLLNRNKVLKNLAEHLK